MPEDDDKTVKASNKDKWNGAIRKKAATPKRSEPLPNPLEGQEKEDEIAKKDKALAKVKKALSSNRRGALTRQNAKSDVTAKTKNNSPKKSATPDDLTQGLNKAAGITSSEKQDPRAAAMQEFNQSPKKGENPLKKLAAKMRQAGQSKKGPPDSTPQGKDDRNSKGRG